MVAIQAGCREQSWSGFELQATKEEASLDMDRYDSHADNSAGEGW